jgi:hypothetical protein
MTQLWLRGYVRVRAVACLADAMAWPVFAHHRSRRPLRKAGPFEVEWIAQPRRDREGSRSHRYSAHDVGAVPGALREELAGEAASTPGVAVLEAHATIERTLCDLLSSTNMPAEQTRRLGVVGLARLAQACRTIRVTRALTLCT